MEEEEPIYEWAILPGMPEDEMPDLPDACAWEASMFLYPPEPYLRMDFKEGGPLFHCHFEGQLQDDVWIYEFEDSLIHEDDIFPGDEPKIRGRLAIRPLPSPLVLNCAFSLADCKHFEAVCFNLAGREVARVQAAARLSLTMEHLTRLVKDVALGIGILQSRNQQVHVLLNGSENVLAKETLLFDWLKHGGRPGPATTRKRKAPLGFSLQL